MTHQSILLGGSNYALSPRAAVKWAWLRAAVYMARRLYRPEPVGLAIDKQRDCWVEAMRVMVDALKAKSLARDADEFWVAVRSAVEAAMTRRGAVAAIIYTTPFDGAEGPRQADRAAAYDALAALPPVTRGRGGQGHRRSGRRPFRPGRPAGAGTRPGARG